MAKTKLQETKFNFGQLLKACRTALNLTQKELSQEVGLDHSTISKYESGVQTPSKPTALHIVNILARQGAPGDDLVNLREEANHLPGEVSDRQLVDPSIITLNRFLEKKSPPEAAAIGENLLAWVEIEENLLKARKFNKDRKWQSATQHLDIMMEKLAPLVQRIYMSNYFERASASYNQGEYSKTILFCEIARRHTKDDQDFVKNHLLAGLAYRRVAKWDDAVREIISAKKLLQNDPYGLSKCYRRIIGVSNLQAHADESLREIEKAFEFLATDDPKGLYKLQQHKAWALSLKGKWDQSIELYEEALKNIGNMAKDMTEEDLMLEKARAYRYQADVYGLRPEWYDKAKNLYRQALETLELLRKRKKYIKLLSGMNLRGLGRIFSNQLGYTQQAQEYLDKSEAIFLEMQEPLGTFLVYNDKGALLSKLAQYELAEGYLREARSGLSEIKNIYFLGETFVNLCELSYLRDVGSNEIGEPEKFADLYQVYLSVQGGKVKGLGQLFNIHYSRIQSFAGRAYLHQGQFNKAYEPLYNATSTGLSHNIYVFQEMFDILLQQVAFLMSKREYKNAHSLCRMYEDFWANQLVADPMDKNEVERSLLKINEKQREIETIAGNGRTLR